MMSVMQDSGQITSRANEAGRTPDADTHPSAADSTPDPGNLNGIGWNWNVGVLPIKVKGRGYSRNEIAKGTGLSREFVARIFSGKRRVALSSALTLAAFFQVDVEYLLAVIIPENTQPTRPPTPVQPKPRKPKRY